MWSARDPGLGSYREFQSRASLTLKFRRHVLRAFDIDIDMINDIPDPFFHFVCSKAVGIIQGFPPLLPRTL